MGFSEADSSKCRRHPNQRQSPGVCSTCLREKLTKLSTSPSFNRKKLNLDISHYSSSASSTPPYSSASSSTKTIKSTSTAAGATTRKSPGSRHRRNGSEAYVSVGMVLNDGLKKSRSVSCAPLSRTKLGGLSSANDVINERFKNCVKGGGDHHHHQQQQVVVESCKEGSSCALKKKNGFLKKLIHTTSKKTKGVLMHSKTMKERSSHLSTTISASSTTNNNSKNKT